MQELVASSSGLPRPDTLPELGLVDQLNVLVCLQCIYAIATRSEGHECRYGTCVQERRCEAHFGETFTVAGFDTTEVHMSDIALAIFLLCLRRLRAVSVATARAGQDLIFSPLYAMRGYARARYRAN